MTNSIALPQAGPQAIAFATFETLEALENEFGETYVQTTFRRLDLCCPTALRLCFDSMVKNRERDLPEVLQDMSAEAMALALADALHLALKGTRISEITEAA